jgi:alanine racemase
MSDAYRCWAEIDLSALRQNARVARTPVAPGVELLAVIKANGYGHGLTEVARALASEAQLFGVANVHEAIEAREVVPHPVLIMGPALPSERAEIIARGFIASVSSHLEALEFSRASAGAEVLLNCAIDTGMGRMGITESDAAAELAKIASLPRVKIHSVSSHLPSADSDAVYTREQLARFTSLISQLREQVPGSYRVHMLPSAGVIGFGNAAFDVVRAGLMLYGISPIPEFQQQLVPALVWKTRVALVREIAPGCSVSYGRTFIASRRTRVATLSVGYADGLLRSLSNRGSVLIGGCRCPVIGRVTMDLTMVDVTDLPHVASGDEAVLIGRQRDEQILASEVAENAGTIAWEVFTGIGSRVARVYV